MDYMAKECYLWYIIQLEDTKEPDGRPGTYNECIQHDCEANEGLKYRNTWYKSAEGALQRPSK
jgi:hypothetical protein